ncbi:unnamed protein product [Cercopithifilaria johnstoni]|uniref:Uncharacterized protein n=1 Tax=Cercopithifilaria johnstoni TaxID=2874296 RepID=A0A8J2Q637_9BILA|nr:unnamed protein product [Cercopithifilaria johnstoni]
MTNGGSTMRYAQSISKMKSFGKCEMGRCGRLIAITSQFPSRSLLAVAGIGDNARIDAFILVGCIIYMEIIFT